MLPPVFFPSLGADHSTTFMFVTPLQEKEGIPWHVQGLVHQGRQLQDELPLSSYGITAESTVHLVLSLRGGKGGFGALLRGLGRDGKGTTNFDACRDLSGRRVRHTTIENKLKEWQASAHERELEKLAQQHIKEMARQQRREEAEQVGLQTEDQGMAPQTVDHRTICSVGCQVWVSESMPVCWLACTPELHEHSRPHAHV